ncbi:uncharacterized protein LOC143244401 isoform X2 [Tachypleus tridentatus]|uniref:uncharacterized protein LOC143244401 isoform X2 n=1 Tax=Tachypleus tridentatus TaxID=6853 RepID=UPI003FD356A7
MASDGKKMGKSHDLFQFGFTSKTNESEDSTMEPRVKKPKLVDLSPSVKAKTVTASTGTKPTRCFQDERNRGRPFLEYNNATGPMFCSIYKEYD